MLSNLARAGQRGYSSGFFHFAVDHFNKKPLWNKVATVALSYSIGGIAYDLYEHSKKIAASAPEKK